MSYQTRYSKHAGDMGAWQEIFIEYLHQCFHRCWGRCPKSWNVLCVQLKPIIRWQTLQSASSSCCSCPVFPPRINTTNYPPPPDLSSSDSFRGIKSNGFWPVVITSKRYPRDKPYMPAFFILVPATWMTWNMQPITIYTNLRLSTNPFIFWKLEFPL